MRAIRGVSGDRCRALHPRLRRRHRARAGAQTSSGACRRMWISRSCRVPAAPVSRSGLRRAARHAARPRDGGAAGGRLRLRSARQAHAGRATKSRYTVWQLPYAADSGAGEGLRPTIQVELNYAPLRRPPVTLPVSSFVAEATKPAAGGAEHRLRQRHRRPRPRSWSRSPAAPPWTWPAPAAIRTRRWCATSTICT